MTRAFPTFGLLAAIGAAVWGALFCYLHPLPLHLEWAELLLLLAALVLVPLGMKVATRSSQSHLESVCLYAIVPGAFALTVAFALPEGTWAALLAVGWFIVTLLIAGVGFCRISNQIPKSIAEWCMAIGMIYLAIGGGWAVLSRAGLRPLDFEPTIVLLTAIHFHYAGFLLPLLTGLAIQKRNDRIASAAGVGVIVGVPLVAIGITATQLGFEPWIECAAAWMTSIAGLLTAYLYGRLSTVSNAPRATRLLRFVCTISLTFGMVLAALYGTRFYLSLPWLDIPWMRALHGTANAIGFGFCGLLSWLIANRNSNQ